MSTVAASQARTVLNAFAAIFENELVSKDLVTWKQYDGEFNDRNRLEIVEQIGPRYEVVQTTDAVANLTGGTQASQFGSERFLVNRVFNVSMGVADFAKVRDFGTARENTALKNAATNLAEQIDAYVMGVAGLASNNWVGTPSNTVATYNDFVSGYTRLKEEGVSDADLRGALNFSDKQALGSFVVGLGAPDAMATRTFKSGFMESVGGIPVHFTQQLPAITTGTRVLTGSTQPQVNASTPQNVNYADVAESPAPGQYMTQLLVLKEMGTTTINAGEVFTIAGVNAYDNRAQKSLGRLQQFRVITGGTAVGGALTIRIFPAIIVPGSGTGANIAINTANATVTAAPTDGALLTFLGAPSTALNPRFIIQKEAIVCNTVPLVLPDSDTAFRRNLTSIPLSVRMWKWSTGATGQHSVRFDVVLNANVRDRRRIVRINGA